MLPLHWNEGRLQPNSRCRLIHDGFFTRSSCFVEQTCGCMCSDISPRRPVSQSCIIALQFVSTVFDMQEPSASCRSAKTFRTQCKYLEASEYEMLQALKLMKPLSRQLCSRISGLYLLGRDGFKAYRLATRPF